MIHRFGDLDSTTGDHLVGVAGATSHDDGVVDRQPDAGAGCRRWYNKGVGRSMKPRSRVV
jgi:hypothetical protein